MIEKANLGITLAKKESVASIKQKNTGAGVKTLTYKQTLVEQTKKPLQITSYEYKHTFLQYVHCKCLHVVKVPGKIYCFIGEPEIKPCGLSSRI